MTGKTPAKKREHKKSVIDSNRFYRNSPFLHKGASLYGKRHTVNAGGVPINAICDLLLEMFCFKGKKGM